MSSMGYKKQQRRELARATSPGQQDQAIRALASKVLSRPDLLPTEFLTWLPTWLSNNINLRVQTTQLPTVEARRFVGDTSQPAFQNSWVAFGGSSEAPGFYKDAFGRVFLFGSAKSGTVTATIFTLPVGYRPKLTEYFPVISNGVFGYCAVNADGTVVASAGSNVLFSLSGISFRQYG